MMASDATPTPPHVFESAYYDRLAELERRHWWGLGMRAAATRTLDRITPATRTWRVFDAGCGTGLTLAWLRRFTDVPAVGLDYAADALRYCAASGQRRLLQGTATALPVADARFDLVVSMDVMQHLPRPGGDAAMLGEIARILEPGGWFFLRTNSRCGYHDTHVSDYHRYTLPEVRELLAGAGFEIDVATYANCVPGLLATLRERLARRTQSTGDPGLFMVPRSPDSGPVVRLMYWLLLLESVWIGRFKRSLPFGHSILVLGRKPESTVGRAAVVCGTLTG